VDDIEVLEATVDDKPVVRRLLELYSHDFSEFTGTDVDAHGRFGYPDLDLYWTNTGATAFWRRAIPFEFAEAVTAEGWVQRFSSAAVSGP
jgi:hypothetical protein